MIINYCLKHKEVERAKKYIQVLLSLGLSEELFAIESSLFYSSQFDEVLPMLKNHSQLYHCVVEDICLEFFERSMYRKGIEFLIEVGQFENRVSDNYYLISSLDERAFNENTETINMLFEPLLEGE